MALALILTLTVPGPAAAAQDDMLIIDDRSSNDYVASSGMRWRLVTDGVMGGVSSGDLEIAEIAGRACLRLRGDVRLDNNGGFIQAALDLGDEAPLDASAYEGVLLEVYGNDEAYNVHLRTRGLRFPWQAYRATFTGEAQWKTLRLPFGAFAPYRTSAPLDLTRLTRIGVVAIGRPFAAELCIGRVGLYPREDPPR